MNCYSFLVLIFVLVLHRDRYVSRYGLQSLAFGFSLTNEFGIEMAVFNGKEIFSYTARPTAFAQLGVGLNSGTIHPALDGFFRLTGECMAGLNASINLLLCFSLVDVQHALILVDL